MNARSTLTFALLALLATVPAAAGTGYVPVAMDMDVENVAYETQMWVSNTTSSPASFTSRFIPTGFSTPGAATGQITVLPGGTFFLRGLAPAGQIGMLEVVADDGLVIEARLVGTSQIGIENLGASLPLIGASEMLAAGEDAALQGMIRTLTSKRTNLGVINLADQQSQCSITTFRADSSQVHATAVVLLPPTGHRQFDDAFGILGEAVTAHARFEVSCDQPFYTYATIYDLLTGEVTYVTPGSRADIGASGGGGGGGGGDGGGGGGPVEPPPAGAQRFVRTGIFHTPRPGNAVKRLAFAPPPGVYKVLHLVMEVRLGPWAPGNSGGTHNIIWLARDRNRDLFGYINAKGPNSNVVFMRHGIGQPQGLKPKVNTNIALQSGETYQFDYTYDTRARRITLLIKQNGQELRRLTHTPDVNNIHVDPGQEFLMDFGFPPGLNPLEPPTYGWDYKNLVLDLIP